MKEKVKKAISKTVNLGIGVLCDLALIYVFIHRNESSTNGWTVYCQRYITLYTIYSWVALVCMAITLISFEIALQREDYLKKNAERVKSMAEACQPKLWKTLWRWLEAVPMLLFVGIFVGNYHLFTVWGILILLGAGVEQSAKKLLAKTTPPRTFGEAMAELDKKSSMN